MLLKNILNFLNNYYKYLFFILLLNIFFLNSLAFSNFIRDTEIEQTLYKWSNPIFKVAGIPKNSIKIHLVADKRINAFVTDGKHMFINTGLIIEAGSASGLIGVIAHETGHIAAGHIVNLKQTIKTLKKNQFITSLLGMGAILLSNSNDDLKDDRIDIAKTVLSIGPAIAEKSFFSYSRGKEYVADDLAIKYLKKVNRNPASLSIILKKLYGQELLLLERQDPFLRTHPLSKERMRIINEKTPNKNIEENNEDIESYLRIKAKLQGFLNSPGKVLFDNKGNTIHERYARTIAYFRAPMYKRSLNEIDALLKDYPNDPYFLELKGQILSENGFIQDAIKNYKKSLKIIPNSPLILLSLSGLLLENNNNLKKVKEAKKNLDKVIKLEPDNILAWHLKGIAHNKLGETTQANLSAAEEYLRRRDFINAKFFAKRVLNKTKKFSSQNLRASDIIKLVNQI